MTKQVLRVGLVAAATAAALSAQSFIPPGPGATAVPFNPTGGFTAADEGITSPTLFTTPITGPSGTVYPEFQATSNGRCFLVDTGGGMPPPPLVAPLSFTLTPSLPGYLVTAGGTFDNNYATGLNLGLADDSISAPQALSFSFPLPGGGSIGAIEVDSNGKVLPGGSGAASDFSPTLGEWLGDPFPAIAGIWSDLDPSSGGGVFFSDDGTGTSASVTWYAVPQFGQANSNTFQVRLFPSGAIEFNYVNLEINSDDVIIGTSPGLGAADPEGESDYSTLPIVSADDVLYEFFDVLVLGEVFDLTAVTMVPPLPGAGGPTSDFSPSIPELLGDQEALYPLWYDLDNSTLFVDTTTVPGTTIISWIDATLFGGVNQFSFQLQISSASQFTFAYDNRVAGETGNSFAGLVGISPGGGAVDPGPFDYSTLIGGGVGMGGPVVYEEFLPMVDFTVPAGTGGGIDFIPAGAGNYLLSGNILPAVPGSTAPGRSACMPVGGGSITLDFNPTGAGYLVIVGPSLFDPVAATAGIALGLTDDTASTQPLSFMMPMPGGALTNMVDITDNGRIFTSGLGEFADFSASVPELLGDPAPVICALWADLDPGSPNSGPINFFDDGTGTRAVVTWNNQEQFGEVNLNTFQCELFPTGQIRLNLESIGYNTDNIFASSALVGVSPGGGVADADGESDYSAAGGAVISTDMVVYEEFLGDAGGLNEVVDIGSAGAPLNDSVTIFAVAPPIIGQDFQVDVLDTTGTAVAAVYFLGFPTGIFVPTINLGILNPALSSCELLNDIVTPGATVAQAGGAPGTPTTLIFIPPLPVLIGVSGLVSSGLVINPGLSPAFIPTDEIVLTIGNT